jgi:hypothetical protein
MARNFNNTTADRLTLASSAITAAPVTIVAWVRLTAVGTVSREIVTLRNSASGSGLNCFDVLMNTNETVSARTATGAANSVSTSAASLSAGAWAHVGGVFASATSRTAYLNGTAATTETTSRVPTGINSAAIGVTPHTSGSFSLPWRGEIAEVGIWDVALDAGEMTALSKGISPLLVRPASLVYYWPILGKYDPEVDRVSTNALTVTGTTQAAAHPRIMYPRLVTPARMILPVAGGGFNPAWVRTHSAIVGAGVH